MRTIRSTEEIINRLGGTFEVARLTGSLPSAVSNWKTVGHFPPALFLVIGQALARLGYKAPPSLWRIQAPRRRRAS